MFISILEPGIYVIVHMESDENVYVLRMQHYNVNAAEANNDLYEGVRRRDQL